MLGVHGSHKATSAWLRHGIGFDYAFERDEYVFFYKRYPLVNIVFGGL
jgi:hypothetical protein